MLNVASYFLILLCGLIVSCFECKDIASMEFKDDGSLMFDISGELILQLTSKDAYLDSKFIDFYISRLRTKMNSNPKYGKAIFLSLKSICSKKVNSWITTFILESFLNDKDEFNNFWIKKLAKDYRECKPVKMFAPMSNNNNYFSLLEYDLISGDRWCYRNSLGDMNTKKEHY
ncbi:hypothetical protein C5167_034687 [Papaver somniferum]|uniref:Uncharacterized protein n=1 Tax=Papaver somniferum TaxID=3469 RepID=A0A4Y7KDQ0_PAPSO|nr:hypothetical protein C5167_034687 [Papaver somniferum]